MALLVSMVVSLTVIPVLAARFLAQPAPCPSTGPIYRLLAGGYEGLLRRAAVRRGWSILRGAPGGRARLVALSTT